MKVQMTDIVAFNRAMTQFASDKLPLSCAYKISKILKGIEDDLAFFQKRYFEIVDKYGIKNENGEIQYSDDGLVAMLQPDKIEDANKEVSDLYSMEIEIPVDDYLLSISDFESDLKISVSEISSILPFIR